MNEFHPHSSNPSVPDASGRFVLILAVSLALHLALALGVQVREAQPEERARVTMEVHIQRQPPVTAKPLLLTDDAIEAVEEPAREPEPVKALPVPPPTSAEPASMLPTLEMPLLEDPTWYPAKQVDVHPSPLQKVLPEYPLVADRQGVEGSVTLLLLIDELGVVREASVVEANPEGYFEGSALAAFRVARFAPAQKSGRAVKSRVLIRVSFELGGDDKPGLQPPAPFGP